MWHNNQVRADLISEVRRSHTVGHVTLSRTPLDEGSAPSQRPLTDSTQYLQETDLHCSGEIRTRNPSKQAGADVRLRPLGLAVCIDENCTGLRLKRRA
jgi:hypothetical protein